MQAGNWFAAGLDTAALIDIVAFKGSESNDTSLLNLNMYDVIFESPENFADSMDFSAGFFEVAGPYGDQVA